MRKTPSPYGRRSLYAPMLCLLLAGCTSEWDMQGVDPKDYYAANPIINKVERRTAAAQAHFVPGESRLSAAQLEKLRDGLRAVSREAAQTVTVELSSSDMHSRSRRAHLSKLLNAMGFPRADFRRNPDLYADEVRVVMSYAVAIAPDCPDWRVSPVTTYSNTRGPNFGCAHAVNLGLMVSDPRDLVRGRGDVPPDPDRNAIVIQQYRANGAAATSSGSGSSGDSGSSAAAAPSTTSTTTASPGQ